MHPSLYVVAFIDLLGQAAALDSLKGLPVPKEREAWQAQYGLLMDHGRVVQSIRQLFDKFVSEVRAPKPPPPFPDTVPDHAREDFVAITAPRLQHIGFSDCFVLSLEVSSSLEKPTPKQVAEVVNGVHLMLLAITSVSVNALAHGIPLRGGVDLGLGLDLYPNEVYGPAALSAFQLERSAEYPRTLVGKNLLDYLALVSKFEEGPQLQFAAAIAKRARTLICDAPDDEKPMVHFLAVHLEEVAAEFKFQRPTAARWVRDQIEHYRAGTDDESKKLFSRYTRLSRYFEAYPSPSSESAG